MAKVKLNPVLEQVRGQLGDAVFRRSHNGEITLMRKPDMSNVVWSEKQTAHRQRFRQAVAYAKKAMADPQLSEEYRQAAEQAGKRPFDLAVSDFFKNQPGLK
ncbi:MAG: hypothetical protein JXA13_09240 [Anaerolineales bacterium]|nr:hypothetical protein [Anaerolineales bacterium]